MSFVFYDTETTGTNTTFDQILQFGAIRTDHELRELDRFKISCRLLPYVVPSPGAMRVTGVTVEQLTDTALPSHYEMVRTIKAKLEQWSPAVFIGHNSLRFDEPLLRQALYQTLHAPYLTNTNGNCRADSLRIIQAANFFEPNILSVPIDVPGRPTFKLDRLAPANGFNHSAAHDAMGDVEATIYMCHLLTERAGGLWSNFVRFAQKAAVLDFTQTNAVFSLTDFYYGTGYSWMVTAIGPNPENSSELFVFDLSNDPEELVSLTDDELAERLTTRPKPVRSLRANACPCVFRYEDAPDHWFSGMPDIDELRRRAARIEGDEAFAHRLIVALVGTREAREAPVHVEEQIYDEFTGDADQVVMAKFHETKWSGRSAILDSLSDTRLKKLGERLIHVEAPEVMSAHAHRHHQTAIAKRLMAAEGTVPWVTLPKAIRETDDLLAASFGAETSLLNGLRDYLLKRSEEAITLIA